MILLRALVSKYPALPRNFARFSSRKSESLTYGHFAQFFSAKEFACEVVQCKDSVFRFDIDAPTIFQFDSGSATNTFCVPSVEIDVVDDVWLNAKDCSHAALIERLIYVAAICAKDPNAIQREEFDAFVDSFTANLVDFDENEFIAALQVFSRVPMRESSLNVRNYTELWMAMDDHSAHWAQKWPTDKLMFACDVWMRIPFRRKSSFFHIAHRKLLRRAKTLPPKQFLEAMFIFRSTGKELEEKTPFIKDMERVLDDISVAELATLSRVLDNCDTQRLSKPDLITRVIEKVLHEPNLADISNRALSSLLKVSLLFFTIRTSQ